MTTTTRILSVLATLAVAACGASGADGDDGDDGGNVGFGGAQDIGQFRGILDAGEIPGVETLDANGFFAEHYSELPPATCGQVLCLNPMLSVGREWLSGSYQATVQIALTTPIDPATLPRLPLNLVAVIDHSGSMSADGRMEKVKQGLHLLIDSLEPGDRLALVKFDSVVTPLADFTAEPDLAVLHAHVDALYPRGATNIYGGLQAGLQIASDAWVPDRQNRLLFLSDGVATSGIINQTQILDMADRFLADGMSLSTIGVGLEFDVALMRGLAEHGSGNFYFLEDAAAVNEVFTQELDTSLQTLALDVRIYAIAAPSYDIGTVTGTRVWSVTSDGGEAVIPAVFMATRQSQQGMGGRRGGGGSIFLDLSPITGQINTEQVATILLTYRIPGSNEEITQTVEVTNPLVFGEAPEDAYVSQQAMMEHYAAYNMYLGLHEATFLAEYRYDCALAALDALRTNATRWNSVFADPDITADLTLVDQFAANLRAKGARNDPSPTQAECTIDPNNPPYPDDEYYGEGDDMVMMCSTSSTPSGLVMILFIAAALRLRRRR